MLAPRDAAFSVGGKEHPGGRFFKPRNAHLDFWGKMGSAECARACTNYNVSCSALGFFVFLRTQKTVCVRVWDCFFDQFGELRLRFTTPQFPFIPERAAENAGQRECAFCTFRVAVGCADSVLLRMREFGAERFIRRMKDGGSGYLRSWNGRVQRRLQQYVGGILPRRSQIVHVGNSRTRPQSVDCGALAQGGAFARTQVNNPYSGYPIRVQFDW